MTAATEPETGYYDAVVSQLQDLGSVTVTAEAVAYLLAAAARPAEPVPHDDVILLWRALLEADRTLATETWAQAWNTTAVPDRLALLVLASRVPGLDPHH